MGDLIDRSALIEKLRKDRESVYSHVFCHTDSEHEEVLALDLEQMINNQPTVKAVPLSEIYRVIAGHSNYHGDSILAALTCISEGKKVEPIKPVDAVPVVHGKWLYNGFVKEWECSECHSSISLSDDRNSHQNFCPNCGADMRKKVQE